MTEQELHDAKDAEIKLKAICTFTAKFMNTVTFNLDLDIKALLVIDALASGIVHIAITGLNDEKYVNMEAKMSKIMKDHAPAQIKLIHSKIITAANEALKQVHKESSES